MLSNHARRRVVLDAGPGGSEGGADALACALAAENLVRYAAGQKRVLPGLTRRGKGHLMAGKTVAVPDAVRGRFVRQWAATEVVCFRDGGGKVLWTPHYAGAQRAAKRVAEALGLEADAGFGDAFLCGLPVPGISVPAVEGAAAEVAAMLFED